MENLKLNETPVRTARNFRINNIKPYFFIIFSGLKTRPHIPKNKKGNVDG